MKLSNRLLQFDSQFRHSTGATKVPQEVGSVSTDYLDGLSRGVRNDPDLRLELANG